MQAARGTSLNEHPSAPEHSDTDAAPARRRPHLVLFAVVAVVALAADVVSKAIVAAKLPLTDPPQPPKRLFGGAIYLDQVRNSGAAFSLGAGFTVVLTVVALAVVVVIVRAARRLFSAGWSVALALVLGGALGNLSDRVFRAPGIGRGHVVDWISVFGPYGQRWPIFNLADSAITCGAVLAAVLALLGIDFDGRRATREKGHDDA